MKKSHLQQIAYLLLSVIFILIPLISGILFCLRDGRTIREIYIPLGGWSDEITYYKQIEGILAYGLPRGFFGYNQSRAIYGPFGVWGIFPLIPYVLWGLVFGWGYCQPIYANIFFCILALCVFYFLVQPSKKWMISLIVYWLFDQFLNRYVLSGVVEASFTTQLIFVTALGQYLLSDHIRSNPRRRFTAKKDSAALIFCTFFIAYLTIPRPYYAVFFLIPFWKCVRDRQKTGSLLLPLTAAASVGLYFINSHFFCSTYFSDIIHIEELCADGISSVLGRLFSTLIEIARLIWYAVRYPGIGLGWHYLMLGLELAVMVLFCIWKKIKRQALSPILICTLIGDSLILLSLIELYDIEGSSRHIIPLIITNAFLLVSEIHWSCGTVLALVGLLSIFRTGNADGLPYQQEDYVAYMETLKADFADVVQVSDHLSYDNVVAMPTADTRADDSGQGCVTYYGLMFAMPAGVGISLDFEDYYDDPDNIKAGYILVHPDGRIRLKLENIGMHCIYEDETLALYGRG